MVSVVRGAGLWCLSTQSPGLLLGEGARERSRGVAGVGVDGTLLAVSIGRLRDLGGTLGAQLGLAYAGSAIAAATLSQSTRSSSVKLM